MSALMTLGPNIVDPGAIPLSYDHDAYVSYSDSDADWAQSELIKRLEETGLTVIHKAEFLIGVSSDIARGNAVEKSRHIIVVLTEEWCKDRTETFDAMMASTADPDAASGRLLPLWLRDCELPPRFQ